jgi:hypothetical protein
MSQRGFRLVALSTFPLPTEVRAEINCHLNGISVLAYCWRMLRVFCPRRNEFVTRAAHNEDRAILAAKSRETGFSEAENPGTSHPPVLRLLGTQLPDYGALHTKFAASSVLPFPAYEATCGYGHSGRVRSTTPPVEWEAII